MKALILNSGMGMRMGTAAPLHPKCLTEISAGETILGRQLRMLAGTGIDEVVMTTGPFGGVLEDYCQGLGLPVHITFVQNPAYKDTNYIYSIYCARDCLNEDIILMHGDLVFEHGALSSVSGSKESCMAVSSTVPLPKKDFKAVVRNGHIIKIGTDCFLEAVAAQPLYKLKKGDWKKWLDRIVTFCESGKRDCYAEDAFNEISDQCRIYPLDVRDMLCTEVDDLKDLAAVRARVSGSGGIGMLVGGAIT